VQELQQRHREVIDEHLRNTRKLEDSLHTQLQINARGQQQMMDDLERPWKENERLRIDLGSIVQTARNLGRMALQSEHNGDPSVLIRFIETVFTDSFPPRFSIEAGPVPRSIGSGVARCPRCGVDGDNAITISDGGQVFACERCRASFTAEVRQRRLTGRSR
jgi:hypothetical protein